MKHNGKEVRITLLDLPISVHGVTAESDDDYLVAINKNAAAITQRHATGHELAHIWMNHFSSNRPLRELEREANRNAWHYYRAYRDNRL